MKMLRLLSFAALAVAVLAGCASAPPPAPKTVVLAFPPPPEAPRFVFERAIYSSADVVPDEANADLRRMVTGESRTGEGLAKPYAVAVHQGKVFVSDSAERYIKVFDVPGARFYRIGEADPGRILKPLGIDVDRAGRLYVADASARDIKVFDAEGKFVKAIGGPKYFDRLSSVTVDPEGRSIYVVDIGGVSSEHHRVRVFDAATGEHVRDIGKRGAGPGEFNLPRDLAIGKDGRLYVVDGGNFRVQVFDAQGAFVKSFGSVGKQFGQFARPKEVAVGPDGNVYVVDAAFGNFQIFDADGQLLLFIGDRAERDAPAKYMLPSGIYVDGDGRVYLVDQWFRKVEVFRPVSLAQDQGALVRRAQTAKAK